jgi:2,4-dienoyl-CoA reductase-like NADH-dependent reductase (Old Yellow Enzyme family)
MCQYSAVDGVPDNWHLVHLGSRAVGGAALVTVEATAISAVGRITLGDLGIWNDKQVEAFKTITRFIKEQGAVPAIQLAHAGRKSSTAVPWLGHGRVILQDGGWIPDAPSAIAFSERYHTPRELSPAGIMEIVGEFAASAKRAKEAGFQMVELHMAHGYLVHEFLSPLSNHRKDEYGGSLENRMRFPLQVTAAVREAWPKEWPVSVRISAADEGGWDIEQSVVFAKELKKIGIDLIDCSSGGTLEHAKIPVGPGYQVEFASRIRKEAGIATSAVGFIVNGAQADLIIREGSADIVSIAREFLRDPYFPLHAAKELGVDVEWPKQYGRGKTEALAK